MGLCLTNVILEVITERSTEARENERLQTRKEKELDELDQKRALLQLFREMDIAHHGYVSYEDLTDAYDSLDHFRSLLRAMDIQKDEIKSVFKFLDRDSSGGVDYAEFCDQVHRIRTQDTRTMLAFLKLTMSDLKEETSSGFRALAGQLAQHKELL